MAAFAIANSAAAQSDKKLLDEILINNKAMRESIRTFAADVVSRGRQSAPTTAEIAVKRKYWRDGDRARLSQAGSNGAQSDVWFFGSEGRSLGRAPVNGTNRLKTTAGKSSRSQLLGDPWGVVHIHFFLSRTGGGAIPLEELLTYAKSTVRIKEVTEDGQSLLQLEFEYEDQNEVASFPVRLTVWFTKNRNYHVWKMKKITGKDKSGQYESYVREFVEYEPGRFFPVKIESSNAYLGKTYNENTTILENVRINEPIGNDVFAIPNPPQGTVCHDQVQGTDYQINSNWEQIGPAKQRDPAYAVPQRPNANGPIYTSQTLREPRRVNWWLVGALSIIGVGLATSVFRWFRGRWGRAN